MIGWKSYALLIGGIVCVLVAVYMAANGSLT